MVKMVLFILTVTFTQRHLLTGVKHNNSENPRGICNFSLLPSLHLPGFSSYTLCDGLNRGIMEMDLPFK